MLLLLLLHMLLIIIAIIVIISILMMTTVATVADALERNIHSTNKDERKCSGALKAEASFGRVWPL